MKLATKLLAGALALAAAGVASAQVTPSPSSATGSDLLFIAFDLNAKTSFVMDLGIADTAFPTTAAAISGNTWSVLSASSQFGAYESGTLTAAGLAGFDYGTNALAGTQWAVVAGQTGSVKNLDVTAQNGATIGNSIATKLSPIVGNIGTMVGSTGLNNGNITPAQLQAGYFSSSWDATNAGFAIGQGDLSYSILNNIGQSANFVAYNYTGGTQTTARTPSIFGGAATPSTFNFDGANLTYSVAQVAAVPEPSSYAMMLAGLLMVGAMVARRRDSK